MLEVDAAGKSEARFADAAFGSDIARLVDDPETLMFLALLAQDGLEQTRIDALAAPRGQRDEIVQVAIASGKLKRYQSAAKAGLAGGRPTIGDNVCSQEREVRTAFPLHKFQHMRRGKLHQVCQ